MNPEIHALSGAYALNALGKAEETEFERHLSGCSACSAEVRGLRETAALLALDAAAAPPPDLRARVLAAARHVRQAPPDLTPATRVEQRTGPLPRRARAGGRTGPGKRRPRRSWPVRLALGLTAAATVAAAVLGVVAFDGLRDLERVRETQRELVEVLAAPDARTLRRPVTSGGTATLVVSRERGRLLFAAHGLPALPEGRVYELWLMGPGGARPAGLLTDDGAGQTLPLLTSPEADDRHLGLTVEPAGGSAQPTTVPLLLAELPGT
ncbi:anti-sigma factor [Nonomuraea sp. NPDC050328]|uniref:anti-sigma factor n=1 Tax=Nonomuraea sp. NPDC050328 TaxID=3364361 RepID=UPI0037BA9749